MVLCSIAFPGSWHAYCATREQCSAEKALSAPRQPLIWLVDHLIFNRVGGLLLVRCGITFGHGFDIQNNKNEPDEITALAIGYFALASPSRTGSSNYETGKAFVSKQATRRTFDSS